MPVSGDEFWIYKGDSNFCSELDYDVDTDQEIRARPDGFYDIVATADTVEGGVHVIKYSRFLTEQARADQLEQFIEALRKEIYAHLGHDTCGAEETICIFQAAHKRMVEESHD